MECGAAEETGLGFVCFVIVNPRVLLAKRVDFGLFFCFINFPIYYRLPTQQQCWFWDCLFYNFLIYPPPPDPEIPGTEMQQRSGSGMPKKITPAPAEKYLVREGGGGWIGKFLKQNSPTERGVGGDLFEVGNQYYGVVLVCYFLLLLFGDKAVGHFQLQHLTFLRHPKLVALRIFSQTRYDERGSA